MDNQTFTLTFGDQAENHVGMQKIGKMAESGFSLEDLKKAQEWFESQGVTVQIVHLNPFLEGKGEAEDAYLLIARNGLDAILKTKDSNLTVTDFFQEQDQLPKDTKAYMYGRVVNKKARYNLCFNDEDQEPNYEEGKGRIVSFNHVPLLSYVRNTFPQIIGEKGQNLMVEGNYYYDITKCGIGFHGDTERLKVIGVRVGASLPLHYHWFHQSQPVGKRAEFIFHHGDIYIMSEKTTGQDWKKRSLLTLRHAGGCKKFLEL